MVEVALKRLHPAATVPRRMTEHAAGYDLAACLEDDGSVTIGAGERAIVSTGWALAIPSGFEGQVRPRSGLAFRHGVTVLNAPGTIDADYRGELKVLLLNAGDQPFVVQQGERIAQLVIAPVAQTQWSVVDTLADPLQGSDGQRGTGGFGSTGR